MGNVFKITKIHFGFLFIALVIGIYYYVTNVSDVKGFSTFEIQTRTPADQIARQRPLAFEISISGNTSATEETGVRYDGRKLRLERIEPGQAGEVIREDLPDEGNDKVMILRTRTAGINSERRSFATLHFMLIDETDETNSEGLGFANICTLFNPGSSNQDDDPEPTTIITNRPTSPQASPTIQGGNLPTQSGPTPTTIPAGDLDTSQICIPLEVNGSPADKMDIVFFPYLYQSSQYDRYYTEAQLAVRRLKSTNLSQYQSEVLGKMNWYVLNPTHARIPAEFRGKEITTEEEYRRFVAAVMPLCPNDRYIILTNSPWLVMPDGGIAGGVASLYEGAEIPVGVLYRENDNAFAHEWGHMAAGLLDEYDAGKWLSGEGSTAGYNCTLTGSDLNPQGDPCPNGSCSTNVNNPMYQKACPQWDCSQKDCTTLERELYAGAGCYPRCSTGRAFRPDPVSLMDAMLPTTAGPEALEFNGPSLYSIIEYTFGLYR